MFPFAQSSTPGNQSHLVSLRYQSARESHSDTPHVTLVQRHLPGNAEGLSDSSTQHTTHSTQLEQKHLPPPTEPCSQVFAVSRMEHPKGWRSRAQPDTYQHGNSSSLTAASSDFWVLTEPADLCPRGWPVVLASVSTLPCFSFHTVRWPCG